MTMTPFRIWKVWQGYDGRGGPDPSLMVKDYKPLFDPSLREIFYGVGYLLVDFVDFNWKVVQEDD